jgi:hypothetical protein
VKLLKNPNLSSAQMHGLHPEVTFAYWKQIWVENEKMQVRKGSSREGQGGRGGRKRKREREGREGKGREGEREGRGERGKGREEGKGWVEGEASNY